MFDGFLGLSKSANWGGVPFNLPLNGDAFDGKITGPADIIPKNSVDDWKAYIPLPRGS